MKKFIFVLVCISFWGMFCNAQFGVIKTPTNVSIESEDRLEAPTWLATWEAEAADWIAINHSDAIRIGPASYTYNCHCYAWNSSDGGVQDWIYKTEFYTGNPNVTKYFGGSSPTYTSTNVDNATKIFLQVGDHSMINSPNYQGWYQSKWGAWPLYKHSLYSHPYNCTGMEFYKLNITGDNFVCYPATRTYSTLNISGATNYTWTAENFTISGSTYTASATTSGNGPGKIKVSITSPYSNTTINGTIPVWVGPPQITNQKVDGGTYYTGMQICPGNHYLTVTPIGGNAGSATWTVPSGIPYSVGTNLLNFTFPSSFSSVAITCRSTNSCGTGTNGSFYLTKKTYGCSGYFAMTVYPNPASDNVTISMIEDAQLVTTNDSDLTNMDMNNSKAVEPTTYTIKIYNSQSALLSTVIRSGKSFNIPLINMRDGIYIIEVNDGNNSYRQQLIVKHD